MTFVISRKVCTYCKCPRDHHDVANSDESKSPGINGIQVKLQGINLQRNNGYGSDEDLPPPPPPSTTIYQDDGVFDEFPDVTSIENDAISSLPAPPVFSEAKSSTKKYLWSPPGLNSSQVDEYFRELPQEKVPIPGTQGMKYYDEQLTFQNPPQDRPQLAKLPAEQREPISQFWKKEERKKGVGVVRVPFGSKQVYY